MPRLPSSLLRYAASQSKHLPRLLRECRDLDSATNELRWLSEHAVDTKLQHIDISRDARLTQYVHRRARGEPLQYILGSQPFGDLNIQCRKGVLIPRPETEAYTMLLARLLHKLHADDVVGANQPLKIADLCTGTGCIALLLHSLLVPVDSKAEPAQSVDMLGVDVSPHALKLAHENLNQNLHAGLLNSRCSSDIVFEQLNVLKLGHEAKLASPELPEVARRSDLAVKRFLGAQWDVIISNPPYISPSDYAPGGTVGRSVREHEPKLALVPPPVLEAEFPEVNQADQFYAALLHTARTVRAKILLMEIGDAQQACRVRTMAARIMQEADLIETWRDDGSIVESCPSAQSVKTRADAFDSNERAVVVWAGAWAQWRQNRPS